MPPSYPSPPSTPRPDHPNNRQMNNAKIAGPIGMENSNSPPSSKSTSPAVIPHQCLGPVEPLEFSDIPSAFRAQAAKSPDAVAVGIDNTTVSYEELLRRSEIVAQVLRSRGCGKGEVVGMVVEKSVEMVYGILGVLMAGCAYVPVSVRFSQYL